MTPLPLGVRDQHWPAHAAGAQALDRLRLRLKAERMRFVIYGTGAIGATIGARLQRSGERVVFIARGAHAAALRERGLRLVSHEGVTTIDVTVVERAGALEFGPDDVVLLAMKTQDTATALSELAAVAEPDVAIACAQNGVENERLALRRFERVQGISVMCPAVYLEPGIVQAFGVPQPGLLDVGRYPAGRDEVTEALVAAFRKAGFGSEARSEIQAFKYGKLLFNLGNAIEAICGPAARRGPIADLVRREALDCLRAAGVQCDAEGAAARAKQVVAQPIGTEARPGGSSWQSLARGVGSIETDYLNGEIALLGRMTGIPTPANSLLQRLSNQMARERKPPGQMAPEELLSRLERRDADRRDHL